MSPSHWLSFVLQFNPWAISLPPSPPSFQLTDDTWLLSQRSFTGDSMNHHDITRQPYCHPKAQWPQSFCSDFQSSISVMMRTLADPLHCFSSSSLTVDLWSAYISGYLLLMGERQPPQLMVSATLMSLWNPQFDKVTFVQNMAWQVLGSHASGSNMDYLCGLCGQLSTKSWYSLIRKVAKVKPTKHFPS